MGNFEEEEEAGGGSSERSISPVGQFKMEGEGGTTEPFELLLRCYVFGRDFEALVLLFDNMYITLSRDSNIRIVVESGIFVSEKRKLGDWHY